MLAAMNTVIILTTEESHLRQVLELQYKYHVNNLGKQERGFLTFRAENLDELVELANDMGVIVALNGNTVVGYDILMSYQKASHHPLYTRAVSVYTSLNPQINTFQIGISAQYCMTESYRGGWNVKKMFETEWERMRRVGCVVSIGEVDALNAISLACVTRILRYTVIGEYQSTDGTLWKVAAKML
jgi:hypothetical protein